MNKDRNCATCGSQLKGRSDKKFCDDYCRSNFNNQLKAGFIQDPLIKTINKALQKNRKILESLMGESQDTIQVSKEKMLFLGFHFGFITHLQNRNGETTYCCYDYGYIKVNGGEYLLSRFKLPELIL
jgi:hypothetical protein